MKNLKTYIIAGTIIAVAAIVAMIYFVAFRIPKTSDMQTNQDTNNSEIGGMYHNNTELGYELQIDDEDFVYPKIEQQGLSTNYYVPSKNPDGTKMYSTILVISAIPNETANLKPDRFLTEIGKNNYYTFSSVWLAGCDNDEMCALTERINESLKKSFKPYSLTESPTVLTFEDKSNGYGFKYPVELEANYFTEGMENYTSGISLPKDIEDKGFGLGHDLGKVLKVQYCTLKGDCGPTTVNYSVATGEMDITEKDLLKLPLAKSFTKTRLGTQSFMYDYSEGAEGEGINYHFIPVAPGKIVIVAHRYINEQVVTSYQKTPNFTKYEKQLENVTLLMESINTFPSFNEIK